MGRRRHDEDLFNGKADAWLFLESLPNGDFRPCAASLARERRIAEKDMPLAGHAAAGPLVLARVQARVLVDFCPGIPVYLGSEEPK